MKDRLKPLKPLVKVYTFIRFFFVSRIYDEIEVRSYFIAQFFLSLYMYSNYSIHI